MIDWDQLISSNDIDTNYQNFMKALSEKIEKNLPMKEITISHKQLSCEPWLTKSLRKCGQKQLKLYESSIKSGNMEDRKKYREYRSVLQKIKCRCKLDYYNGKCISLKNNTKQLWKLINNVASFKHDKSSIIDCIKVDKIKITESNLIAQEFGKYFASIGYKVSIKGGNAKNKIDTYLNKIQRVTDSMFLAPCSSIEISRIIDSLPNKNSSGYDDISNILLKRLEMKLVQSLLNCSMTPCHEGNFHQT